MYNSMYLYCYYVAQKILVAYTVPDYIRLCLLSSGAKIASTYHDVYGTKYRQRLIMIIIMLN